MPLALPLCDAYWRCRFALPLAMPLTMPLVLPLSLPLYVVHRCDHHCRSSASFRYSISPQNEKKKVDRECYNSCEVLLALFCFNDCFENMNDIEVV
mmetsp:Transcript_109251/g.223146  ORF Transcript_109251/g.223146 Transcript_109251/m.223146 type:complete len:96 (+) Transcript_109251:47-334(+)